MDRSKLFSILIILFFTIGQVMAQVTHPAKCIDINFEKTINTYLSTNTPTITVADAYADLSKYTFLDARELDEYQISHIKGARYIGYDDFDISRISQLPKDTYIIVYCSIGYRSEKITNALIKAGYLHVWNLYGSIFEWVNQHHEVVDPQGNKTNKVHTYDHNWSKWISNDEVIKVYR